MNLRQLTEHTLFRPVAGAALAVVCGVLLSTRVGDRWANASYDNLFRFGSHAITNKVVVILMDNAAYAADLGQSRDKPWDRALHAKLLNKLADDECPMVVMDVFFREENKPESDHALAAALSRQRCAVLMAEKAETSGKKVEGVRPLLPTGLFLNSVRSNWGMGYLIADLDSIVRHHWPYPAPGAFDSLPWTAAKLAGARLPTAPSRQWLRYYGDRGAWENLSYHSALTKVTNYFRDKIVFIGNEPTSRVPDKETDKFSTPYVRWTGDAVGGVQILVTEFLNLLNGDWLTRIPKALEFLLIVVCGMVLGGGLGKLSPFYSIGIGIAAGVTLSLGSILLTHFSNLWFPWLIVVGGQLPCSLVWSIATATRKRVAEVPTVVVGPGGTVMIPGIPVTPDYELFDPPLGEGAFGKVWLVRNAIGQWQALKAVYAAKFGQDLKPYEAEFKGIKRYKPISDKHPGLLRVDFVSKIKREGYFYYVMELGDSELPGWQEDPTRYKARDLASVCRRAPRGRLLPGECLQLALILTEALDFLHRQGLLHRDIKPSNVIFVNGRPKLADIGLVTEIRPVDDIKTWAGTAGYMPPPPEPPGTVQADIYAFGMALYVISTAHDPSFYPELKTVLAQREGRTEFARLDAIILKACQPDIAQRYQTAAELLADLKRAVKEQPVHSA